MTNRHDYSIKKPKYNMSDKQFWHDQKGSYEFNGFQITLYYNNGSVKQLPTFSVGDGFEEIWFEGSLLSRRK
jgi:hypothetical protein